MITIDPEKAAFLYCFVAVAVVFGLWCYYDRRDRKFYETDRKKVLFHCIRCDKIFTRKLGEELADCPRCGYRNTRLKF